MHKFLYSWRYYSFGREQYHECMSKLFVSNLGLLKQTNTMVAVLVACCTFFPILIEKNIVYTIVYLATALIALLLAVYANYKMQVALISNRLLYTLITIYFVNIISFGLYIGVWTYSNNFAVTFMSLLICSLLLFITPPQFNLCLILGAMTIFIVSTVIIKTPDNWLIDICNVLFAGFIGLFLSWEISKLRLGLELSTTMLEDERNKYFSQSTIDELTKLKNRRDFMQTFQRYLTYYRTSDDWLCIAIADIDFFKNYNDHYGHPKGDECLRSVGGVFNSLSDTIGVYSARVGGEEFALLWFEQDVTHVGAVASRISEAIRDLKIPHEKSKVAPNVTLSIGIYVVRCGVTSDMKTLYDLADKALYTAKTSGRNCAVVNGSEIEQFKVTPPA